MQEQLSALISARILQANDYIFIAQGHSLSQRCSSKLRALTEPLLFSLSPEPQGVLLWREKKKKKSDQEQESKCAVLSFSNVKKHDWCNILSSLATALL